MIHAEPRTLRDILATALDSEADQLFIPVNESYAKLVGEAHAARQIFSYMNRPGQWNGGDVCEVVAEQLDHAGFTFTDYEAIEREAEEKRNNAILAVSLAIGVYEQQVRANGVECILNVVNDGHMEGHSEVLDVLAEMGHDTDDEKVVNEAYDAYDALRERLASEVATALAPLSRKAGN